MAATCEVKLYTSTDAGTENPATGDANNMNLLNDDSYDTDGTTYKSKPITVPTTGTNYSYERWVRLKFTGTFNNIENTKVYKSSGSLSDANLDIKGGETATGVTPVNTASSVATAALTTWDAEGEAVDITPAAGISNDGDKTDYWVMQLVVPDTVTTPGDIGSIELTFSYDES